MISAATANFAIAVISMVFVYLASVTCIGAVQAWIAAYLGDESAVDAGYLSLNPAVYCDPMGLISLLIFGFGWSRSFPFQPDALTSPFKKIKIFFVYLTRPLVSAILAIASIVGSVAIIGAHAFLIIWHYASMRSIFHPLENMQTLAELHGASSAMLVLLIIFVSAAALNIFLAAWSTVNSMWDHMLYLGTTRNHHWMHGSDWLLLLIPLFLFIFLFPIVHFFMLNIIMRIAYFIIESAKLL